MPQLVGKEVGPIGYGLMGKSHLSLFISHPISTRLEYLDLTGFTWRPNPAPEEQAFKAMRASLAAGCNFWNAGEFYGTAEYNSLHLLNRYL